jgi:hypothetical protein
MEQNLPIETQTLYAELLERMRVADLRRSLASLTGGFVKRVLRDKPYWYFRTSEGISGQREFYIGADDEATRARIETVERQREAADGGSTGLERMAAMLRIGGATTTDGSTARIIRGLSAAGVFRLGGILIGTHAYATLGNAMGVRWSSGLATQDVDLAAPRTLGVGVPQSPEMLANVPRALEALDMGFLPCVHYHSERKPTSYAAERNDWKVDFLTVPRGRDRTTPVHIPRLNVYAQPLEFMDYLIELSFDALVLNGAPILVKVPEPARFGLHKLLVASNRDSSRQVKAAKDRQQAYEILSFLALERPGDIELAAEALRDRGPKWVKRAVREAEKFASPVPGLLVALAGKPPID